MSKLDDLQHWFLNSPLGRNILATEEVFYHNSTQNIFGYYAIQTGLPQINFLSNNKISSKMSLGRDISCDLQFLPFETNSIDLIICPHTLEFTPNHHIFLQECYRILIPKGKIIVSNFNPRSLLAVFGKANPILKQINYISVSNLQQQLSTLNFNICGGKFFNYLPPFNSNKYLHYFEFFNKIGDRWFPTFANSYALVASKDVVTPTFVGTRRMFSPKPSFAPNLGVAGSIAGQND
jgi:SAM-dependent methyltransferase